MRAGPWLGVAATLLVACAGKSDGSAATGGSAGTGASTLAACDPLRGSTTPVQLEASLVVAAGEAEDGVLYVMYDDHRLFVGNRALLSERRVLGSGQSSDQTDLSYAEDDGTFVTVELVGNGAATQMFVARGAQSGKGIDSGNQEPLTLLDSALVAELPASTADAFTIDFAASLPDARELVVVAPVRIVDYAQFRVFFGPPSALAQRAVTNFGSSKSGQRYATVTVDGEAEELTYLAGGPSELNPNPAPSTLTIAGTPQPLTEGPAPADTSYLCFRN